MGLNAFFVYTVCIGLGLSYANALVLILGEGLIFILLTVTGLRKKIFETLPDAVRVAIPGGIACLLLCWVCKMQVSLCPTLPPVWIWLPSIC